MCGIAGMFGAEWRREQLDRMVEIQCHRGPDDHGVYVNPDRSAFLGHTRLSILDLSAAGHQPMCSADGMLWISFNGEIYNYRELRQELAGYPFRTATDTEVILAAYQRWGETCLDRLIGMFAFLLWDHRNRRLLAVRDRFGVKPLYYYVTPAGGVALASEIPALHAAGVPVAADEICWANYLAAGHSDHTDRTFWVGIRSLPPGHLLRWRDGNLETARWYDISERVGSSYDERPESVVAEEYLALMRNSVALRFRSDVPVGVNLSGGLDSSILLGLIDALFGEDRGVTAFTYVTGDPRYDELPWVAQMLDGTRHPSVVERLWPDEVPELAASVQQHEAEPFGGLPTLAYAKLFERARRYGILVLLDGQGMDEQWAGYDYYRRLTASAETGVVQGTRGAPVRPECLTPEFRALVEPFAPARPFADALRCRQYWDTRYNKIPRALRFNDRVSMRSSTELREPFLDHRMFELALRQPPERKIRDGVHKYLLRETARMLAPGHLVEAPKRPLQTPQREWLRGALREWAEDCIADALHAYDGCWLRRASVNDRWRDYLAGRSDNSFFVWQWISIGLMLQSRITFHERYSCQSRGAV